MTKPKLYATAILDEELLGRLSEACEVRRWTGDTACPSDVIEKEIPEVEAFLGWARWSASLMDRAPRLRIIANVAVGYDNVDVAAATERGIIVTNTPDVLTDTTADLAFALLLASARRLGEAERYMRAGLWGKTGGPTSFLGVNVHHATLGLIGMGRIGQAVARRALGFGMRVLYHDAIRREELEKQHGYQYVDMDTLLAESDFVSLHVPLSSKTRGLMGKEQFSRMKPTAYLINASRGPVVDECALIEALRQGEIAGAGLDVFDMEPCSPDNPLLHMENVVVAPHIGSATTATRRAMAALAVDNVIAVMSGKPPLTPVNPEVLTSGRSRILS